ncbi:superfamily II DNA or RNA helicase [Bosea sp. BE271]|uniref:DEAD/DEAH box helicase n=1 Tax=Bosea TaxID=85413 RepID=UPI00285654D4|nr:MULTISPECIES: DEAD/DEAH box helicase family protein [Bosea]MDR6831408.1 superfamily II DNA or RNA helicase [Bosea robiniae]MDR6898168.1 superfamily II DNA or RNA helicase [Bosea sp. BE109]MDR7141544.1 superfamily II DNA or RNA helicase [Bosea sp. BE168]MDR7178188.1 superfamily II DNA or RNA helicase [Bosea sp. BE271]
MPSPFETRTPSIEGNLQVRTPQREAYAAIADFATETDREAGVILPVGCGKSGTIALAPFAFRSRRTLVIAPNLHIAKQLCGTFDPSDDDMFYRARNVLDGRPWPELVEIRGTTANRADLDAAEVVVTNIQQLSGADNRWLTSLPNDYFDLILFDEGHHNVAQSWNTLKAAFPAARVLNFSATPMRADGQIMSGRVIYSYPVARAIREGYVKRLKAVVLNPRTLRYVRREDGQEIEVDLEEVRRLGEDDADFRRSIVTSEETLNTIVDASIRELDRLRGEANNNNLKIIASALNYEHCRQVVQAYRARNRRADYVHSREEQPANDRIIQKLENNELDVIVQVRKLGEGFDHPLLAVAAVFSMFGNLSPFVQFVGRIMRVVTQNAPNAPENRGVVVFHAGANCARRWTDFQAYTEADQEFFDELLPMEGLDFTDRNEIEVEPVPRDPNEGMDVRFQSEVHIQEIPLIEDDVEALELIRRLRERGYDSETVAGAMRRLEPVDITRVRQRQASRAALDTRVQTEVGRTLGQRGVNHQGRDLDRQRRGRTNFVVLKSAIDRQIHSFLGVASGERSELSQQQLDDVNAQFVDIVARAVTEVFDA